MQRKAIAEFTEVSKRRRDSINKRRSRNNSNRWIALSVASLDHEVVGIAADDASWSSFQTWVWMLAQANHKEYIHEIRGQAVPLKRGQFALSERQLGRLTGWGRERARSFLKKLIRHGMIAVHDTQVVHSQNAQLELRIPWTRVGPEMAPPLKIVTLCNYNKYNRPRTDVHTINTPTPRHYTTLDTRDNRQDRKDSNPINVLASQGLAGQSHDQIQPNEDGVTSTMLADVVRWMYGGDEMSARQWLTTQVALYGAEVVRDSYAKLRADLASGKPIGRPLQTWCGIAARLKAERSTQARSKPMPPPEEPLPLEVIAARLAEDPDFVRGPGPEVPPQ